MNFSSFILHMEKKKKSEIVVPSLCLGTKACGCFVIVLDRGEQNIRLYGENHIQIQNQIHIFGCVYKTINNMF